MQRNLPSPGLTDGYKYLWNQAKSGWQKYGGRVCTIAGTAGLFAAGIHACRKTYRIHDELEENGKRIQNAKAYIDGEGKLKRAGKVIKEAATCTVKTSRHYAADILAAGAGAYMVHKGWKTEHTHYEQAAAMFGIAMADFMNYRNNVIAEQGSEADRRFLTGKRGGPAYISSDQAKNGGKHAKEAEDDTKVVQLEENDLRIWYSKETTPQVWSDSLTLRKLNLDGITNKLCQQLVYSGSYTINDVRREFYGRQADIGVGGMFGRVWDPGDPDHPERGALVNLHYEEDEDFMTGRSEGCYIIIDIDPEPLFESMARKNKRELEEALRSTIR